MPQIKNVIWLCLLILLAKEGFCSNVTYTEKNTGYCIKTTKSINIREDSTINSAIIGKTSQEELLKALGEKYGWYKIILPLRFKAFIYKPFTKILDNNYLTPTVDRLNIRSKPNKNSHILGIISKGEKVKLIRQEGEWYEINPYPFASGWVIKKYTQISKEACSPKKTAQILTKPEVDTQKTTLPKIIGAGVLKKINPSDNCPANYLIKTNHSRILLRIKSLNDKANSLLGQYVQVGGKIKESPCVYIDVDSIEIKE